MQLLVAYFFHCSQHDRQKKDGEFDAQVFEGVAEILCMEQSEQVQKEQGGDQYSYRIFKEMAKFVEQVMPGEPEHIHHKIPQAFWQGTAPENSENHFE